MRFVPLGIAVGLCCAIARAQAPEASMGATAPPLEPDGIRLCAEARTRDVEACVAAIPSDAELLDRRLAQAPLQRHSGASTVAAVAPVDELIPWLLHQDGELRGVPWTEVVFDATGNKVLRFDPKNEADQRVVKAITAACDETIRRLNAANSPIQKIARINEVSGHFEDSLRDLLNSTAGMSCDFPRTAQNKVQRSGYPDLRIVDVATKRVFYLDPKLFAAGARDSSFRTFYFEPKSGTNKVRDDAVHFIVGFEHQPREQGEDWKFTRWDLVDLSNFKVKLKAEFEGSNKDMYRPEAIVASGRGH